METRTINFKLQHKDENGLNSHHNILFGNDPWSQN